MNSIKEVFRPSTKAGRHQGCLSLRIIGNRKCRTVTIPNSGLYPEEWDKYKSKIIFPFHKPEREELLRALEKYIAKEKAALHRIIRGLEEQGAFFDAVDVANAYRRFRQTGAWLSLYCEHIARQLEARECERMARAYRSSVARLIAHNHGRDVPLDKMTAGLIKSFENRLLNEGLNPNTIAFYMRNLRSLYNKAIAEKFIEPQEENPFIDVITNTQRTIKRALPAKDMRKLLAYDLSRIENEGKKQLLVWALNVFQFSFYMRGMSYVDVAYLRKENIEDGFIRYHRKKTGTRIEVKMTLEMQEIISSFAEETQDSPYVFPIINPDLPLSPRKQYENGLRLQNVRLKKLAKAVGVRKNVSTHVARHSWASIGKQKNLPLSVISECLGHSTERMTAIYLSNFENNILDNANKVILSSLKLTDRDK